MEDAAVVNLAQKQLLSIQAFLTDWHVRVTWIAFITLWILWALTWFVRNIFGGDGQVVQSHEGINSSSITPGETYTDPQTGQIVEARKPPFAAPSWSVNVFNRLNRGHDLMRDLVLMLLSVLTLNTFARASRRGAMVISWVFVALAVVTFVIEASYQHRLLRLVYCAGFYGMALAIVGLAFLYGFH